MINRTNHREFSFARRPIRVRQCQQAKVTTAEILSQAASRVHEGLGDTKALSLALRIPLVRAIQTHFSRQIDTLSASGDPFRLATVSAWHTHFSTLLTEVEKVLLSHIFFSRIDRHVEVAFGKIEQAVHFYLRGNLVMAMGETGTPTVKTGLQVIDTEIPKRWKRFTKGEETSFHNLIRINLTLFGIGYIKGKRKSFPPEIAALYAQSLAALNQVLVDEIAVDYMASHMQKIFQDGLAALEKRKRKT